MDFPGQEWNGGFPGIVLGEKLGEGNEGPAEHRGHGADHSLIQGLLLLSVNSARLEPT